MTLSPRLDDERRVSVASLRAPALVGAAGLGAAVLLHLHDPHDSGSYGYCPFLQLTGKPCPGCGGLRAVNDLTRGDFVAAVSSNVLAVALVAGLGGGVGAVGRAPAARQGRSDDRAELRGGLAMLVAVVLAFGVLRNTPWGSWLAP